MFDTCGGYAFQFLDDIDNPPVQLFSIGVEERDSASYCWHNKNRDSQYLFQYTLSGCGFYFDGKKEHRIPPGTAMFLRLPGDTSYYYKEGGAPWRFGYVLLRGSSVEEYYRLIISRHTELLSLSDTDAPIKKLEHIYQLPTPTAILPNPLFSPSIIMCKLC